MLLILFFWIWLSTLFQTFFPELILWYTNSVEVILWYTTSAELILWNTTSVELSANTPNTSGDWVPKQSSLLLQRTWQDHKSVWQLPERPKSLKKISSRCRQVGDPIMFVAIRLTTYCTGWNRAERSWQSGGQADSECLERGLFTSSLHGAPLFIREPTSSLEASVWSPAVGYGESLVGKEREREQLHVINFTSTLQAPVSFFFIPLLKSWPAWLPISPPAAAYNCPGTKRPSVFAGTKVKTKVLHS